MTMSVADAITRSRSDILDDPDGDRWSDAEVRRHLEAALDDTYNEYLIAHGTAFNRMSSSIQCVNGSASLASYSVGQIHGVAVVYGQRNYFIPPAKFSDKQYSDNSVSRTLAIEYAELPVVGLGTTTNPLVASSGGTTPCPGVWRAFEELVCIRAAMSMAEKDGRVPASIANREGRVIRSVMMRVNKPKTRDFPTGGKDYYGKLLRWYYDPENDSIQIWRKLQR